MAEQRAKPGNLDNMDVQPEEAMVSKGGPYGVTPRDKSPEHQYKPEPGDNNNFTPGSGAPKGPVNIGVKGGAEERDATEPGSAAPSGPPRDAPPLTGMAQE